LETLGQDKKLKLTTHKREQLKKTELEQFKNVLEHPAFKANPLSVITEHVKNSVTLIKKQNELNELETKKSQSELKKLNKLKQQKEKQRTLVSDTAKTGVKTSKHDRNKKPKPKQNMELG